MGWQNISEGVQEGGRGSEGALESGSEGAHQDAVSLEALSVAVSCGSRGVWTQNHAMLWDAVVVAPWAGRDSGKLGMNDKILTNAAVAFGRGGAEGKDKIPELAAIASSCGVPTTAAFWRTAHLAASPRVRNPTLGTSMIKIKGHARSRGDGDDVDD